MPDAHDGARVIFDIASVSGVEYPWLVTGVMGAAGLAAAWAFRILQRRKARSRFWRFYALGTIALMSLLIIATNVDYFASVREQERIRDWPTTMRARVAEGPLIKLPSKGNGSAGSRNPWFRIANVEFPYGTWSVNANVPEELIEELSEQGVHTRVFYSKDVILRIESE